MKTTSRFNLDSWGLLDKYIKKELDDYDKKLKIEELCRDYHKTRAIHSACTLADLLYDVLYN